MHLGIVGGVGGTHVGWSLRNAALRAGHTVEYFDYQCAFGRRWLQVLSRRLLGRRPVFLHRFGRRICTTQVQRPFGILIATGLAPVALPSLRALEAHGVCRYVFLTDDPFSPTLRARWLLEALRAYSVAYSPRRANLADLRAAGVATVEYLPFGYDRDLFFAAVADNREEEATTCDLAFVGGGDLDRVAMLRPLLATGIRIGLYGDYWDTYAETRPWARGRIDPAGMRRLALGARVALCLVRRSNRDGHVMRSFEAAACGSAMLVERTAEHCEIFGPDGEAVRYFEGPRNLAARAVELASDAEEVARLRLAVVRRISGSPNTYDDRLAAMISRACPERAAAGAAPLPR